MTSMFHFHEAYCPACEKTEGNISLESLSNSTIKLYCDKHAPPSHKRSTNADSTAAGPSAYSSDSGSSSSATRCSSKRRMSSRDKQEESPSKRKCDSQKRIVSDDSSNSDENEPNSEMAMFAPIESDIEESANSVPEQQIVRKDASPTAPPSGNQPEDDGRDENKDEDEAILYSDSQDSQSLLLPVEVCMDSQSLPTSYAELSTQTEYPGVILVKAELESVKNVYEGSSPEQSPVHSPGQHTPEPSVPQQTSTSPPPRLDQSKPASLPGSPLGTSSAVSPAPSEPVRASPLSSPSSPTARPADPKPNINSSSFWKSCNAAGCTQAIFTDFINGMNDIASRIQSDQASQEDYDLALSVMAASGKLSEFVAKQQEELQRKQTELQKAAAAMMEVISALKSP